MRWKGSWMVPGRAGMYPGLTSRAVEQAELWNPGPGLASCSKSHGRSGTAQQEPGDSPELWGQGRLREEEPQKLHWEPSLTAAPPPRALQPSITVTWWLYSPTAANGLFLYNISSWGLSLWTGSRTRKGLIHSHWCSVLNPPQKPNKTNDKKLDRPTYGNICNSRDLEAQNKNAVSHHTGVKYPTWSCSSLKASLVLTQQLLSFASSKQHGSTRQATPC